MSLLKRNLLLLFFILSSLQIVNVYAAQQFAFDLYQQVNTNENIIISPYGLATLLNCLSTGSTGSTKQQFMHVLQLQGNENPQTLCAPNSYLKSITVSKGNGRIILNSASALWGAKSLKYKPTFLNSLKNDSSISFFTVDFKNNMDSVISQMNQWMKTNTNGRITNMFSKGAISSDTLFMMMNAIYFKGNWEYPFEVSNTKKQFFFVTDKAGMDIPMMTQTHDLDYYEDSTQQVLILPYTLNKLAFAVFLPKPKHSLAEIENKLNGDTFNTIINQVSKRDVNVTLPKFSLESTFSDLTAALQKMGLTDMFTPKANFKPLTDLPLIVSEVIQKAIIQVDEEGTVAAAGSAIMMVGSVPSPAIVFNANHPFLFIIFDPNAKTIFFMGKFVKPVA